MGILLIQIPVLPKKKEQEISIVKHILSAIEKTYQEYQLSIPQFPDTKQFKIDYSKIDHNTEMLESLRKKALSEGVKLLSKEWKGTDEKYLFELKDGRQIKMTASLIKTYGVLKDPDKFYFTSDEMRLERLRKKAISDNIELLDEKWIGLKKKYRFAFPNGKEFTMTAHHLMQHGAPKDYENYFISDDDYLAEIRKISEHNGALLLSNKWKGDRAKYCFKFEFDENPSFELTARHIKEKGFPPDYNSYLEYLNLSKKCTKTKQELLKELKDKANLEGVLLLSTEWKGSNECYSFLTPGGVIFEVSGQNFKKRGCPKHIIKRMK